MNEANLLHQAPFVAGPIPVLVGTETSGMAADASWLRLFNQR